MGCMYCMYIDSYTWVYVWKSRIAGVCPSTEIACSPKATGGQRSSGKNQLLLYVLSSPYSLHRKAEVDHTPRLTLLGHHLDLSAVSSSAVAHHWHCQLLW